MEKKHLHLSNNETYYYLEQGTGDQFMILIHGNLSSSVYYYPLLNRLPENIHVFTPDLRGFGDSSYHSRITSLVDLADDISLFMTGLNIPKAIVVGWSLGGGVAMEFAAKYPEKVEKLVLLNSTTHKGYPIFKKDASNQMMIGQVYSSPEEMANDPIQVKPLLETFRTQNFEFLKMIYDMTIYTVNKPSEEESKLYIGESLKQRNLPDVDFALASQNMSNQPSFYSLGKNNISNITMPVLHLWGDKDKTVPEVFVLDNVKALEANSKYIRLEDCGHSLLVDKPNELAEIIVNFIEN